MAGFQFCYTKGFSQFSGLTKSNFQTDADITFFKFVTCKFEYENFKNTNNIN